jgi:hypothetical protein
MTRMMKYDWPRSKEVEEELGDDYDIRHKSSQQAVDGKPNEIMKNRLVAERSEYLEAAYPYISSLL